MVSHRTVLLVEDEPTILDALGFALRRRGYHVEAARNGNTAADLIARKLPDVAIFGMLLPGQSGFRLTELLKERSDGRVPVVLTTSAGAPDRVEYALALGADGVLVGQLAAWRVVAAIETLCPLPPEIWLGGTDSLPRALQAA